MTTFKTEVHCAYCGKSFLDGLKGIRKEKFICDDCEERQMELFMSIVDLRSESIRFNNNSEVGTITSGIAGELLEDLSPMIKKLQETEADLQRCL